MYKVFIENRPVILSEKSYPFVECITLFSKNVKSVETSIVPLIKKSIPGVAINILTEDPHAEFERLFGKYDKIDAAGGIVKRENKYLFIKRNGCWDIPKGKLDKGESPEKGAVREIEEECGIAGPVIDHFICRTYHTYKFRTKWTLKRTFWYALNYNGPEELVPQLEEGITKVKWFGREKLFKVRNNTFISIHEVMDHYFKPEEFKDESFDFDI